MKRFRFAAAACALLIGLSGCGYVARDGELIGQAKKWTNVTPVFCGDYVAFDISLGIMQNGTGSMSTQDMWLTVANGVDLKVMKAAVEKGQIVKIRFDTRRAAFCTETNILTAFEVVG